MTAIFYFCAHTQTRVGALPSINYNQKLKKDWNLNLKAESRHLAYQDDAEKSKLAYEYSLSDLSVLIGKRFGLDSKLVGGLLMRVRPDGVAYRTMQQFIMQTERAAFRFAHRIASDQTFSSKRGPEFRWRYRVTSEVPLSGQKVDTKEFYFKLNVEILNRFKNGLHDMELRVGPHIGFVLNDKHNLELGFDNRIDNFLDEQSRFTSWLAINWFVGT